MKKLDERDLDDMMAFLAAVSRACKEIGKEYTFVCPVCGGQAYAVKRSCDSHCFGACSGCGTRTAE